MPVCTFFGHRDCPATIRPRLRAVLVELIEHHGVERFYVGRQGAFDRMAQGVLRELADRYAHIHCTVVLERLPLAAGETLEPCFDTVFPEGMESVPPRFAIARRNDWMLRQADCVVVYVTHSWGGAAQFAAKAQRLGKMVYTL